MDATLIRTEGLVKSFGANHVIRGVDLDIRRGEILTLIGKSGGGKSILLKLLIGILEPDAGRILFAGRPLDAMRARERRELRMKMSYVFQGTALLDSLTVFENVALPLQERRRAPREEIRRRVGEKMRLLDLADVDALYPSQLSGGMRKRVALARALVTEPEVVLFDEPTTGLDPIRKHAVHSLITDYQQRLGFTAVLVSHEIPDVFYISQRIAMLDEGRIVFAGTPDELRGSANPVIREFLGGLPPGPAGPTALAHPEELDRCFTRELAGAGPGRPAFTLVGLTVENLDEVNARLGYQRGQIAMKNLLDRVRQQLRVTDTSARVGLDRVAVMLSGATLEEAQAFAGKLAGELKKDDILEGAGGPAFCLAVSAGFAEAGPGSRLIDVLAAAGSGRHSLERFKVCAGEER